MNENNKKEPYDKQKYIEKNSFRFQVKLYSSKDSDVINKLKSVPSKLDYIRQLIREDIARHSEDTSDTKKGTE